MFHAVYHDLYLFRITVGKLISKNKAVLAYVLYGILLTVCFLYFFFPAEAFKDYLKTAVSREYPELELSVGGARPCLPFGVKFSQTELTLKENPVARIFISKSLKIRPAIGSFLRGNPGYVFHCNAYGGRLNGDFRFAKDRSGPLFSASVKLRDIHLDDLQYLPSLLGQNASGILGGVITYRGLTDGTGEAHLKISDGNVVLQEPFFNLEVINFNELMVKLALKQRTLEVSHAKMKGPEIQGTLIGTIGLKKDFLKSILNLKGTIEILSALFQSSENESDVARFLKEPVKIPFRVRGTIQKPNFKFI